MRKKTHYKTHQNARNNSSSGSKGRKNSGGSNGNMRRALEKRQITPDIISMATKLWSEIIQDARQSLREILGLDAGTAGPGSCFQAQLSL